MAKWMTLTLVVLAVLYGGYWFIGATILEREAKAALGEMQENGWTVEYDDLSTRGFPSRFDTTVEPFRIIEPNGRAGLDTPFLQVFALSYRPNEVIVVWPKTFGLIANGIEFETHNEDLRASAAVEFSRDLVLDRATIEGTDIGLRALGRDLGMRHMLSAIRKTPAVEGAYDVYLKIEDLSGLDLDITRFEVDGVVALSAPIDRHLRGGPKPLSITIDVFEITTEDSSLSVRGEVERGADGFPEGQLLVSAVNAEALIEQLSDIGVLDDDAVSITRGTLAVAQPGADGAIGLTLRLSGGFLTLGGVALTEVPRWPG